MATLIRNVEIDGRLVDVRVEQGRICEFGAHLSGDGAQTFDGKGHALIPGLHDHHIHLNATAAAMNSTRCGPPEVESETQLIAVLNEDGKDWIRGVGYHHSVAGEINRDWLDKVGPDRPIRIQHRSGRLWILNSLAMQELGLKHPSDGRILDADFRVRQNSKFPDLEPLINRLLSFGITGVTEVTPSNGREEIAHYLDKAKPLRLSLMGRAGLDKSEAAFLKLHYHDHNLPSLEALAAEISEAHTNGRNVAAHCVTRAELMLTLAALEEAGPLHGDRIEHAAIADSAAINWMKRLGVIVVTQPNFIQERVAAYEKDVPQRDHENLWRLKSFIEANLSVSAGSDAPFGDPNPWKAMAAAVARPKGFEAESISPETALGLYTKPTNDAGAGPRKLVIGAVADMCLLDRTWVEARNSLADVVVQATWIDGSLVYNRVNETPI